jgi:hypothetical protein
LEQNDPEARRGVRNVRFTPKADMVQHDRDDRFVALADIDPQSITLVG